MKLSFHVFLETKNSCYDSVSEASRPPRYDGAGKGAIQLTCPRQILWRRISNLNIGTAFGRKPYSENDKLQRREGIRLSKIPLDLEKIAKGNLDKEILRAGIIAELDAINLYEQMAALTENKNIRKILLDIAREEKTHIGEFQTLLLKEDKELGKELEEGRKEVEEETGL